MIFSSCFENIEYDIMSLVLGVQKEWQAGDESSFSGYLPSHYSLYPKKARHRHNLVRLAVVAAVPVDRHAI